MTLVALSSSEIVIPGDDVEGYEVRTSSPSITGLDNTFRFNNYTVSSLKFGTNYSFEIEVFFGPITLECNNNITTTLTRWACTREYLCHPCHICFHVICGQVSYSYGQ